MPELIIEDIAVQVPEGANLIQAARKVGVDIPHFCYHPGLSVVGSCRMCQVEIEQKGQKRIDLGCANMASDGMIVRVNAPAAVKARQAVMEFLLMNHPTDCPICDDAGECKLQDYYMVHGLHDSRLNVPKWHKPKVYPVGPRVILDAERCVLCSRCVRFCDEIVKERQLGIFGHGSREVLLNYPGQELDNDYSVNVVDLCPVGALLERKFRFQRRVWYLKSVKSVCPQCSRGCNIYLHFDTNHDYKQLGKRVFRIKPRHNPEVNHWWICDRGRGGFAFIDVPNRARMPLIAGQETTWDEAVKKAADLVLNAIKRHGQKAVAALVAPIASNEDVWTAQRCLRETLKLSNLDTEIPALEKLQADHLLLTDDPYPNRRGFHDLSFGPADDGMTAPQIIRAVQEGKLKGLILCGTDLKGMLGEEGPTLLGKLEWLIIAHHSTDELYDRAAVALPMAVYAERSGTFTNVNGLVQKFEAALSPLGQSLPQWLIWQKLAKAVGARWQYEDEQAVFKDISQGKPAYDTLNWHATFGVKKACYHDNWYGW